MPSKVEVISEAFTLLGANPVNEVQLIDNPLAAVASAIYDTWYAAILVQENFQFAETLFALNQLVTSPPTEIPYSHAYQVPSNMLKLIRFWPNMDYMIIGDQIWTNFNSTNSDLYLQMVTLVPEDEWPAWFTPMMVQMMAALMAMPVTQNPTIKQMKESDFNTALLQARFQNSTQEPNRIIQKNSILRSHYPEGAVGFDAGFS